MIKDFFLENKFFLLSFSQHYLIYFRVGLKGCLPKTLFKAKAQEIYKRWKKRQTELITQNDELKFSDKWIKGWMVEYGVSLKKPNKRFAIKRVDRIERVLELLINTTRFRKYHIEHFGTDPPIINGDQMPIHRNESSNQKTLTLKNQDCYVNENYMHSRERMTVYTQISSDNTYYEPQFVLKGQGNSIN